MRQREEPDRRGPEHLAGGRAGPGVRPVMGFGGAGWRAAFGVGAVLVAAYGVLLALSPLPPPASSARTAAREDVVDGEKPDTIISVEAGGGSAM